MHLHSSPMKCHRASPYRSGAPPRSPGPPPDEPLPLPPPLALNESEESTIEPCWAMDAVRFSTLLGASTLNTADLKLLKEVPRPDIEDDANIDRRMTRTRSMIMAGQRIDFGFGTGQRTLRHRGMPMYALANASEQELDRNMSAAAIRVMAPFPLRQIRVRFLVSPAIPSAACGATDGSRGHSGPSPTGPILRMSRTKSG